MRKLFLPTLLGLTLIFWGYVQVTRKGPCEVALRYTIGSIDSRFGIDSEYVKNILEEATHVWENSHGRNLFEYTTEHSPTWFDTYVKSYFVRGNIVVNFVYDDRQKNADATRALTSQVNTTKQSADEIKRRFTSLQNEYKQKVGEYETMVAQYKESRGRGQVTYQTIEAKRLEVNALVDEINALVKKYNYLVSAVNTTVRTINKTAGQEFEEGQYVSDRDGERINIYEFADSSTLKRVLAHELGHALGLDHNKNPQSIMYYLNGSDNMIPTEEDISALKRICARK